VADAGGRLPLDAAWLAATIVVGVGFFWAASAALRHFRAQSAPESLPRHEHDGVESA